MPVVLFLGTTCRGTLVATPPDLPTGGIRLVQTEGTRLSVGTFWCQLTYTTKYQQAAAEVRLLSLGQGRKGGKAAFDEIIVETSDPKESDDMIEGLEVVTTPGVPFR